MAEPQPSGVQEGAADPHAPTSTVEDRKAAAALSTLDAQEENGAKKEVDGKALDKAMKGLSVDDKKKEEEKRKAVKVEISDVNLLVCYFCHGDVDAMLDADVAFRFRNSRCRSRRLPSCCARTRGMRLRQ